MEFTEMALPGLLLVQPRRVNDSRGYFAETFRSDLLHARLGDVSFVQDNESLSRREGSIRGLHFQSEPSAQGKLVRCIQGALLDVVVDIRAGSPTFGHWAAVELSAANGKQMWIPPGFAHGFCTLVPDTMLCYKVTAYYSAEHDKGVAWDDPAIGIEWPDCADPETLSVKDRTLPRLAEMPACFHLNV